jgi:hypothetical protein
MIHGLLPSDAAVSSFACRKAASLAYQTNTAGMVSTMVAPRRVSLFPGGAFALLMDVRRSLRSLAIAYSSEFVAA